MQKSGMQNFSHPVQGKQMFSNSGLSRRGRLEKMCVFNGKLAISWKRWEIWQRLLL